MLGSNFGFLDGISCLGDYESRSICAENPTGETGKGGMAVGGPASAPSRELGQGWKVSPYLDLQPHSVTTLADISGEGAIRHIWITPVGNLRFYILRIYWDGSDVPSVECPLCDFFAAAQIPGLDKTEFHQVSSLAVCVNPRFGLNCYWNMPFRKRCRITVENLSDSNKMFFYQVDYLLGKQPENMAYFHAQFRRMNPVPYKEAFTVADGIRGKGQYVGTYMLWGTNNSGWWGEGEIKFYIDGDRDFPTVCGTGTEDYFCGAYGFSDGGAYREFSTPYSGFSVVKGNGAFSSQTRFSMYRWHITDPVYFKSDLKVTIQALGWRSENRYLPLRDDLSAVAFWYQDRPAVSVPALPDRDGLEII